MFNRKKHSSGNFNSFMSDDDYSSYSVNDSSNRYDNEKNNWNSNEGFAEHNSTFYEASQSQYGTSYSSNDFQSNWNEYNQDSTFNDFSSNINTSFVKRKQKQPFLKIFTIFFIALASVTFIVLGLMALFNNLTADSTNSNKTFDRIYEEPSLVPKKTPPVQMEMIQNEDSASSIDAPDCRYFFRQLNEHEQSVYTDIVVGIASHETAIDVTINKSDSLEEIIEAVYFDYPEYFWFSGGWEASYFETDDNYSYTLRPYYEFTETEYKDCLSLVNSAFQPEIDALQSASDYDKVKGVYDFLATYTHYDLAYYGKTIYELVRDGAAVCDAYARATQYMLTKLGLEAIYVSGWSNGEPHAWNIVQIDDKYYNIDTTWGDVEYESGDSYISYKYLCVADVDFPNHITDSKNYPACVDTAYNWYKINGYYLESYDEQQIASCITSYDTVFEFQCATDSLFNEITNRLFEQDECWSIAKISFGTEYSIHMWHSDDYETRTFSLFFSQNSDQ